MPITQSASGAIAIEGKNSMAYLRAITQRSAIRLEILGMKHSRGSITQQVRNEYGFKGQKKEKILAQLEAYIAKTWPTPASAQ